jgi:peptidoglycan/LPS O-acetylase OafA/YrhL
MRAIAILIVVIGHGSSILKKANTNFPWIKLIDGVELFFVLSGFLIGGILIKIFENNSKLSLQLIKDFWIRRWFRTLPNYYLILFVNIILAYYGIINDDFSQFNIKFFFFLQNFSQPFYNFFWESWSLSIEEWFYLLFPLVLSLSYLILKKFNVERKFILLFSIFIFLVTPFLLRFFYASKFSVDEFWLGVRIYKVVIYRLDGIALGLLAAFIKYWYPVFWFKSRNLSFVLGIIITYYILYSVWEPNDFSSKVYRISIQSIGCFLLLAKFDSIKTVSNNFIKKIITHISLISYSMYLINLALVSRVIRDNFPPENSNSAWAWYVIYWLIVLSASTILFKFFEKPITELREKFSK